MLRFIVRRLLLLIPILIGLSILVFVWIRALPGSPAESLLGEHATEQAVAQIRQQYGLDEPIYVQYWDYLRTIASGNLGTSIASTRTVTYELEHRFPATIELALAAMIFAISVGVPLGFLSAKKYRSGFDHAGLAASLIGISIPIFFLAIILKYIFSVRLGWLPSIGREDVLSEASHPTNFYVLDGILTREWDASWDAILHLILPAIALGTIPLAIIVRITRASVAEVLNEDYVRTAESKGLSSRVINRRHVLKNALLPVITTIGLQAGLLFSGAVLTETVFAFNGIGQYLFSAIGQRDYPVLQGFILFIAIMYAFINLFVDIAYGVIDPRVRLS